MGKFDRLMTAARPAAGGPIVAQAAPGVSTFEGAPAAVRDLRGELFIFAMSNLVGEDTFYEKAAVRDERYAGLVARVAVADVEWLTRFLLWMRTVGHMRSASVVAAAEAVHARLAAGLHGGNRTLIASACQRPDEPGEMVAYWLSHFGKNMPKPVKRGLGDAVRRLYNEYALGKYDTASHAVRFGDVIEIVHPPAVAPWQSDLFRHAIDRRHGRGGDVPESLRMVRTNAALRVLAKTVPEALLDTEQIRAAGMTWEDVLSEVGTRLPKAKVWEALIPVMGLFALARNLRNFDEAGVSDEAAALVCARFTDPAQIARSRMFPYRWIAAYQAAPSLRWGHGLEKALEGSLTNLPALPGRTLILVDTSASMRTGMSGKSNMTHIHAAAVFGVALAARSADVDLVGFASGTFRHPIPAGSSVIREIDRFVSRVGEVGHGTEIAASIAATYRGHDRVVVISDEQTMRAGVSAAVPAHVPLYGVNLVGYSPAMADWGTSNRVQLGGLSDATFRILALVEAGRRAAWDEVFTG